MTDVPRRTERIVVLWMSTAIVYHAAMLKVAVLLCALALSATADEYKGKPVDLDYKAAPVAQVLYTLADIGNVNVVLVDVGASPIV